jgi:predicted GH43/DUF377 family glycosyl hydrolase
VVTITRSDIDIRPDSARVVARPFLPGEAAFAGGPSRVELIAKRVLALDDAEAEAVLAQTRSTFAGRHRDLDGIWAQNARIAESQVPSLADIDGNRRDLLGAYFTQEYTPEAAAVCNPSIVPFPGADGDHGFVMSLRAIGEGHISSVEFRTGRVEGGVMSLDPPGPLLTLGERRSTKHDKSVFQHKLTAMGGDAALVEMVMSRLSDPFSDEDLDAALERLDRGDMSAAASFETKKLAHWLASSNYELSYSESIPVSERILLPSSPAESQGIEDARFTRFVRDDGSVTYYATYTAFDGFTILPQLIETQDFLTFRFVTLNGVCARNKGMALFPRKVDGLYAALGRHDQENLHLLRSDRLETWNHAEMISSPERGWESVQIGACGSPMETEDGWLVITHGVGPMRRYSLGAFLLDLEDPSQMLGRLETPLLEPDADERDGYVPNVVYSCGSMIHEGRLVVPYGYADQGVRVMSVDVDELIAAMTRRAHPATARS